MKETFIKTINLEKENPINEDINKTEIELKLSNGVYIFHETLGVKTVDGWNPENNNGVVGILVDEDEHKIVISLEDAPENLIWSEKSESVNEPVNKLEDAESDFNGEIYCRKLNSPNFPAAYYCLNYKKGGRSWHLPSSGELWLIRRYLYKIQTALETVKGQRFDTDREFDTPWYCSSSEFSDNYAWLLTLGDVCLYGWGIKVNGKFKVRPVSNFIENKNLKESSFKKKDSSNYHSQTYEQSVPSVNISSNDSWRNIIDVYRKDGSVRKVSIMKDRNTGKFCFVNLTSSHVCKCRFDTFGDAIEDLMTREEVEYFDIHYAKDPIIE